MFIYEDHFFVHDLKHMAANQSGESNSDTFLNRLEKYYMNIIKHVILTDAVALY